MKSYQAGMSRIKTGSYIAPHAYGFLALAYMYVVKVGKYQITTNTNTATLPTLRAPQSIHVTYTCPHVPYKLNPDS